MTNWVITFITQVSQLAMVAALIFMIGWAAYLIYKRREQNQAFAVENHTTGFVKKLSQFAGFLARKLK